VSVDELRFKVLVCFVAVKEFLAQAKEEFQKKWDHPPPVRTFLSQVFLC
jgi:hypothetical protein